MLKENYDFKVSASGRVNLIGEHIDYCGGKVFPAALSLKNDVYVRLNGTDEIRLRWTDLPNEVTLDIARLDSYKTTKYANYIAGCLYEWQKAGRPVLGVDMLFDCHVPFGSGLSSSAAIEVSTIAAMCVATGTPLDKPEIAKAALTAMKPVLEGVADWSESCLHDTLMAAIQESGMKNGQVLWPLRITISGKASTPGGAIEIAWLLGREETLRRLDASLKALG